MCQDESAFVLKRMSRPIDGEKLSETNHENAKHKTLKTFTMTDKD